jgi:OmpA-OmpF porin, OOP family
VHSTILELSRDDAHFITAAAPDRLLGEGFQGIQIEGLRRPLLKYVGSNFLCLFRAAGIGVLLASTITVTACSSSSPAVPVPGTCMTNADAPLALVIGERSNVPDPNLPTNATNQLLGAAANGGQQISVIEIDGRPRISTWTPFSSSAGNPSARNQDLDTYLSENYAPVEAGKFHAQVAQANVLAALDMAAEAAGPNGNIIVVDSGLQTVAPLNYQNSNLLMSPPSDVVTSLRQQNLLPDLSGRHVLLDGFGYTALPQPRLDEAERNNLVSQWEAIVTAGGGCVTVDTLPTTAPEMSGLPPVSIVRPPQPLSFRGCGTTALEDAGSVGFVVGTAIFRNPSEAEATLAQLAAKLKQGTEPVTLIGSTSTEGGDAINNPLSVKRAEAVKQVLVSDGISDGRISTVGDGSHYPGRVPDIGPGGILLPGPAEQDREVIVQLPPCS